MLRLHQTFGAHAGRVREIDQDIIRFGRLPTNDFVFDAHADLDASGHHAEIRRENGRWVLVDVGSRNGTLVDGVPVQRRVLEGGEEIEFGTGGPRVRVEILSGGIVARGMPTAPAVPVGPVEPVSPQAPTALAAAPAAPGARTPPPPARATPALSPAPVVPQAMPPSTPFPANARAPSPPAPTPLALPAGLDAPKLYGQRTVEQMIQNAVAQAQARAPGPVGAVPPHDSPFMPRALDHEARRRSYGILLALGLLIGLFLLMLCGASALVAVLWVRARGGGF